MRTIGGALGGVAAIPAAVATGATAAQMAGAVATGTPEGRAAGKWIGDNVPGAKIAANALKPVQNFLRSKLGINQPKAAAPVAKPAVAAKPAAAPAPVAKPSAAPVAAPAKQTFGQAFAAARKSAGGAGGSFTYNNKQYQTNIKGEKYSKSPTPVNTAVSTKSAAPAASAPAKLGGSDKEMTQATTYPKKSSIGGGRSFDVGNFTQTPIQRQDSVPSTDRAAATRQMFDMNRKSPGSTADLANQVDKANAPKPTTAMPKPATPETQLLGSPAALAKDIQNKKNEPKVAPSVRPMQTNESVQVGDNKYRIV